MKKIIRDKYTHATRRARGRERHLLLLVKLQEELDEVHTAQSHHELVEELADLVEVACALVGEDHITHARRQKRELRGGFNPGWIQE